MPFSTTVPQATLAATILASMAGSLAAITPPHPNKKPTKSTDDMIHRLNLTSKWVPRLIFSPLSALAVQTSALALFHPHIPAAVLRHGAENGVSRELLTWSPATAIPLAAIICVGVPLRLVPYSALGRNFTFALAEPDGLVKTGIYRYVQHPSYVGVMVLAVANTLLLGRADGALACWTPPRWFGLLRSLTGVAKPLALLGLLYAVLTRVKQEERMLKAKFGAEWERWHASTARFIPWII